MEIIKFKKYAYILKTLRTESGLTAEALGRLTGLSGRTIIQWESQLRVPKIDYIYKLARYFNISVDCILGLEEYYLSNGCTNDFNPEIFPKRLKDLRIKHGHTQESLSKAINVTDSSFSRWEMGHNLPNADDIINLTTIFGVTADYLLGLED